MAELQQDTEKYVELRNINKTYGTFKASNNINLGIGKGKLIALLGPSGSGKTTILRMIAGLETADSGDIIIDGKVVNDVPASKRGIGFVFQNYNLIPNLSALENVMLPMEFAGSTKKERQERARQLLDQVGLTANEMQRKPGRLSGGQQQRVSIARALANKPKLILADEPTGNLDTQTGKMIFDLLHELARSENTTILTVTHDMGIAGQTDRTFKLQDGKLTEKI